MNLSQADVDYFRSLVSRDWSRTSGVGMPPSGRRVRREYRLLTARERHRLHAALNKLYEVCMDIQLHSYRNKLNENPLCEQFSRIGFGNSVPTVGSQGQGTRWSALMSSVCVPRNVHIKYGAGTLQK